MDIFSSTTTTKVRVTKSHLLCWKNSPLYSIAYGMESREEWLYGRHCTGLKSIDFSTHFWSTR
ncbi:ORF296 [White spot syndrome virus]|uniref:ORF296 n=1 Tax=White spot syndrome virus TaxID=342409 RepID=A0A2D3I6Z7_9VIRU|nr:ORF296 [White spot syndrome virus]